MLVQFGSTVRGTTHGRSDVDLAAQFARTDTSLSALADLAADLQPLFPDRPVDLAIVNRADPLFLKQIMEGGRLLYGEPRRFHEARIYAFRRYQDHRRFFAMERDYVARALTAAGR